VKVAPLWPCSPNLALRRGDGLGEGAEGKRQVDESVLEGLDRLVGREQLEQLQADQPRHEAGGGGDGRDDVARNLQTQKMQ